MICPNCGHEIREKSQLSFINDQETLITEIIQDLNEVTGKNFKIKSPSHRSIIKKRLADGFTLDEFRQANRNMFIEWAVEKPFLLRPQTLYTAENMDSYVNREVKNSQKQIIDDMLKDLKGA